MRKLVRWFSKPLRLALLNLLLLLTAVACNFWMQVFCIPVPWAVAVFGLVVLATVLHPLLGHRRVLGLVLAFVNGVSCCVYLYCIVFLDQMNLWGLFMTVVGLGLVTFIPHFMLVQLLWRNLLRPSRPLLRWCFGGGVLFSLVMVVVFGKMYGDAHVALQKMAASGYEELETGYMTERMLGAHLVYHTAFLEFDGWRPPLHDPALVIGRWLYSGADPLDVDLAERLRLYRKLFPERKAKQACSCAWEYRESYHRDGLWGE